jgi:hypothetical protein
MKTIAVLLMGAAALTGCAIVPVVEPAPVVYAAPPPAVVVAPRPYYRYPRYYGPYRGGPHWYRRWH